MGSTIANPDNISDDELIAMWRVAADDAAAHRPSVCGETPCTKRTTALAECDAYAEQLTERRRVRLT